MHPMPAMAHLRAAAAVIGPRVVLLPAAAIGPRTVAGALSDAEAAEAWSPGAAGAAAGVAGEAAHPAAGAAAGGRQAARLRPAAIGP